MKIPFTKSAPNSNLRQPMRAEPPNFGSVSVAAQYRGARVGGDYYDYVAAGPNRLLVLMLDIAGKRDEAFHVAAAVQETFRGAADMFGFDDLNEAVAMSQLLLEVNRSIIDAAGGVRCAAGVLLCYNAVAGTLWYINAGHTAPILKEPTGVNLLPDRGLPLGLFSHATHDASVCAMPEGSALVLVSRGLVEARAGSEEFGIQRVQAAVAATPIIDAQQLCTSVHEAVRRFLETHPRHRLLPNRERTIGDEDPFGNNDATALALVRSAAAAARA